MKTGYYVFLIMFKAQDTVSRHTVFIKHTHATLVCVCVYMRTHMPLCIHGCFTETETEAKTDCYRKDAQLPVETGSIQETQS